MRLAEVVKKYYTLAKMDNLYVFDVKMLIAEVFHHGDTSFYLNIEKEVNEQDVVKMEVLYKQLVNGKPLAYILGYKYFLGNKFMVNQDVLIPRSETEELTKWMIETLVKFKNFNSLIDIGTGSGVIGLSIKQAFPSFRVYLSDIQPKALEVAKINAKTLNLDVNFVLGDILEPFINNKVKVDVIVSNPPYIKDDAVLDPSVINYEPHSALFAGKEGLDYYVKILQTVTKVINNNGFIFLEIGYDQKEKIINLIENYLPNSDYYLKKDINGIERMIMIHYHQ